MGIATLELRPGIGLGPFSLGMVICDALAQVELQQSLFESMHIKFCPEDPLMWDIVVAFPHLGLHLRFDPHFQRLHRIEVYDMTRLHMRYANSIVGGPSVAPTFPRIYSVLGPTFPGQFNLEKETYSLSYPGLTLSFRIPAEYSSFCDQKKELPLEFPDGTTPVANRLCLHLGEASSEEGALPPGSSQALPTARRPSYKFPPLVLPHGSIYMEEVHAKLGEEIFLTGGGQRVPFGASAQDVWAELGKPGSIAPKQVDTMVIHSPSVSTSSPLNPSHPALSGDYAYSYFTRGLDILFDGQTHRVKKFVLHTNYPGHINFNQYVKCNFLLLPAHCEEGESIRKTEPITADSKWDDVQSVLGEGGRAAIQTGGSPQNAFGPTFVYGLKDVAFEVMRSGHICTVTLFQTSKK